MIRFNNSSTGFEVYEAGTYDFHIDSVTQGNSKSGNPQLTVKSKFVGGKYDGKTFTTWYSLLEQSGWKLAALVQATGCPHTVVGHDAKGNPNVEFDENDLVGCYYTADVTTEKYNNQDNNRLAKERACESVEEAPAPAPAAKAVPAGLAASPAPQAATGTMARRPRTVAS